MRPRDDSNRWAALKFGVGQPVLRKEDPVLLRGEGSYTDDVNLPGQAYAWIVRSQVAHGRIRGIDTTAARAMPGVLGVYTAADMAEGGYGAVKCGIPFNNRDGTPMREPPRLPLAADRVRFVGDPVAFAVAETPVQARDAAEAVAPDIDPLPAVVSARAAAAPGAPLVYDQVPGNVALDFHYGDAAKVAAAFAKAAHVTRVNIVNNRVVNCSMEPRAAIGIYDAGKDRWTLHVCSQGVMGIRRMLAAEALKVPPEKVRVLTGHVGGSFGMKTTVYPEYVCALHAARALKRPVKWTNDRSGSFLSDHHGRDHDILAELALDTEGNFLAWRVTGYGNVGAYLQRYSPLMPTMNIVKNMNSSYRTPAIEVNMKCVFTNTVPVSAYRGAGRPEANYYMERIIDVAAAETGIDPVELRRRNHLRPAELPYKSPSGMTYDVGEFEAVMDHALRAADWNGFAKRKAELKRRGLLRGRGVGGYFECTAAPQTEMGGLRFEADGTLTAITGTLDFGQGHPTAFAQVVCETLGVPFERVRLLQGDSDELIAGGGTGGSRSITASGWALAAAGKKVIERGTEIAAHVLEAAPADIRFQDGRFVIAGTDRGIGLLELAAKLRRGVKLPPGTPASLDVKLETEPVPIAFPNGCHVAEVEIDPETGVTRVVRYAMVNDFGTVINPMLVEGQMHGGVMQGIGQALMENTVYGEDGQLVTGSYMDYALPRAEDAPEYVCISHPVPTKSNPLGSKGCGEAGCSGALPAVMNAVADALSEYGITHIDMPATPMRVWQAIRQAKMGKT